LLPVGSEWRYEIKWDGFRVLAVKEGGTVRLWSRNQKDLTAQFPAVAKSVAKVKARTIVLDGELVGFDADGMPSFQALMSRKKCRAQFFAFDLLHLDGVDRRRIPLDERSRDLPAIVAGSGVNAPGDVRGDPADIAREARKLAGNNGRP
jgi:bifunctional non-homologous end joining protein LigD